MHIAGSGIQTSTVIVQDQHAGTLNRNIQRVVRGLNAALAELRANRLYLASQADMVRVSARRAELLTEHFAKRNVRFLEANGIQVGKVVSDDIQSHRARIQSAQRGR